MNLTKAEKIWILKVYGFKDYSLFRKYNNIFVRDLLVTSYEYCLCNRIKNHILTIREIRKLIELKNIDQEDDDYECY